MKKLLKSRLKGLEERNPEADMLRLKFEIFSRSMDNKRDFDWQRFIIATFILTLIFVVILLIGSVWIEKL